VKAVIQWVPAPLSVKVRDARIYPAANCRCAGSCDGCHGWQLGRDAQLAAVIALTIVLSAVVAWLLVGTVRTVLATWRRVKPSLTGSGTCRHP
jgi:hypothetical protein